MNQLRKSYISWLVQRFYLHSTLRIHMSPRWGLPLEIRYFYKHVAPLGLNEPMHSQPPKSPLSGGLWKLHEGRRYW